MKAFVLFITAIFIAGLVNLFTPKPMPHNEVESVKNICAISEDAFDYLLKIKDVGIICRIEDRREAFIGTYDNGIAFDGKNAYQYIDNQKTQIATFPFEQYDIQAKRILEIAQKIISEGLYTSYADDRKEYADRYYYFRITDEGLLLFDDPSYQYGLIICEYRDNTFQIFNISLKETENERARTWYTFGTIDYDPVVLP